MAEKTLTTRAVAEMLGVSGATVKRWANDELLYSKRTAGGHRRFSIKEIARFLRRRNADAKPFGALVTEVDDVEPSSSYALNVVADLFFDALLEGREDAAAAFLIQPYQRGLGLAEIFDRLFCETMNLIGELWYSGDLTVAQEHLATHTAMSALRALRRDINAPYEAALTAICCSVEDDFHELPVHLAQIIFESKACRVVNLGANTPFFSLEEAITQHRPGVVCISSTVLFHRDRSAHEYRGFHLMARQLGIAVVLGGRGFTADENARSRFPADLYAESFGQLQEFLST